MGVPELSRELGVWLQGKGELWRGQGQVGGRWPLVQEACPFIILLSFLLGVGSDYNNMVHSVVYFVNEETDPERLSRLPKVTQLERAKPTQLLSPHS